MNEYITKNKAVIYETTLVDIVGVQEDDINFIGMKYIGQKKEDRESYLGSGTDFNVWKKALENRYNKNNVIFKKDILKVYEEIDLIIEGEDEKAFVERIREKKRIWLNEWEAYYIKLYDAVKSERYFNQKEGGLQGKHSKLSLKKMSNALIIIWQNIEYKNKRALLTKNQWNDPTIRKKMIDTMNTNRKDPIYRKKLSEIKRSKMKPVSISGVIYESIKGAARALEINKMVIKQRLKSKSDKFKDYQYV